MSKHTPGPWIAEGCTVYQSPQWKDGKDRGSRFIAMAFQGEMPSEEDLANDARLIAVAPELLEACMLLVDNWGAVEAPIIVTKARAAIAKAQGGEA